MILKNLRRLKAAVVASIDGAATMIFNKHTFKQALMAVLMGAAFAVIAPNAFAASFSPTSASVTVSNGTVSFPVTTMSGHTGTASLAIYRSVYGYSGAGGTGTALISNPAPSASFCYYDGSGNCTGGFPHAGVYTYAVTGGSCASVRSLKFCNNCDQHSPGNCNTPVTECTTIDTPAGVCTLTYPLTITSVVVTPTTTDATFTFTSNAATYGTLSWGLTSSYGSTTGEVWKMTSHSLNAPKLTPGVTYHYKLCVDTIGSDQVCTSDATFTTTSTGASAFIVEPADGSTYSIDDVSTITVKAMSDQTTDDPPSGTLSFDFGIYDDQLTLAWSATQTSNVNFDRGDFSFMGATVSANPTWHTGNYDLAMRVCIDTNCSAFRHVYFSVVASTGFTGGGGGGGGSWGSTSSEKDLCTLAKNPFQQDRNAGTKLSDLIIPSLEFSFFDFFFVTCDSLKPLTNLHLAMQTHVPFKQMLWLGGTVQSAITSQSALDSTAYRIHAPPPFDTSSYIVLFDSSGIYDLFGGNDGWGTYVKPLIGTVSILGVALYFWKEAQTLLA